MPHRCARVTAQFRTAQVSTAQLTCELVPLGGLASVDGDARLEKDVVLSGLGGHPTDNLAKVGATKDRCLEEHVYEGCEGRREGGVLQGVCEGRCVKGGVKERRLEKQGMATCELLGTER